jgi:hypothetical protein
MVAMVNPKRGTGYACLDQSRQHGIPETRETCIEFAYAGSIPDEWGAELEMSLPPHLQDPTMPDPWGPVDVRQHFPSR